jgi:hypothetical protein
MSLTTAGATGCGRNKVFKAHLSDGKANGIDINAKCLSTRLLVLKMNSKLSFFENVIGAKGTKVCQNQFEPGKKFLQRKEKFRDIGNCSLHPPARQSN